MPDLRISLHPAAAAEVEVAMQWYAERSPQAARAFAAEVIICIRRVKETPARWPRYVFDTHRYLFPHFPFSLVYRFDENEIRIIAIPHHRRRPGYWMGRRESGF